MRVIFFAVGTALIALSIWLRRMNALAQAWPVTSGVVVSSDISSDTYDGDRSVKIKYQFEVGSKEFTSTCVSFSPMRADLESQEQLVGRFSVGSSVDVFFDPENPTRSVLIRDRSSSWQWFTAMGTVFASLAILFP